jgi:hypothetical protein
VGHAASAAAWATRAPKRPDEAGPLCRGARTARSVSRCPPVADQPAHRPERDPSQAVLTRRERSMRNGRRAERRVIVAAMHRRCLVVESVAAAVGAPATVGAADARRDATRTTSSGRRVPIGSSDGPVMIASRTGQATTGFALALAGTSSPATPATTSSAAGPLPTRCSGAEEPSDRGPARQRRDRGRRGQRRGLKPRPCGGPHFLRAGREVVYADRQDVVARGCEVDDAADPDGCANAQIRLAGSRTSAARTTRLAFAAANAAVRSVIAKPRHKDTGE